MEKIAIYARSATKNDNSISAQIRIIKNANKGAEFIEYIDNGCSGLSGNRPAMLKLMEDAKKQIFKTICAIDCTRLSRSFKLKLKIDAFFKKHDIKIKYLLGE